LQLSFPAFASFLMLGDFLKSFCFFEQTFNKIMQFKETKFEAKFFNFPSRIIKLLKQFFLRKMVFAKKKSSGIHLRLLNYVKVLYIPATYGSLASLPLVTLALLFSCYGMSKGFLGANT
jgi:hypothetical protein